ncbi:hypothetical protein CIHG_02597 [Coccidioides immitis H538.4]|uniref:Uncharacterized protein n=2 Tax=Coccidioides immitis TaxID=5501 RepID=A0A0J8UC75_COCIT|nr:hypothetical protein CIRG_02924 [Coccidioides immitis RMSCC 2394]KMU84813.1 hypothetical protein CIHG_02597 [Coccidioides immitis H538.4]
MLLMTGLPETIHCFELVAAYVRTGFLKFQQSTTKARVRITIISPDVLLGYRTVYKSNSVGVTFSFRVPKEIVVGMFTHFQRKRQELTITIAKLAGVEQAKRKNLRLHLKGGWTSLNIGAGSQ